MVYPQGVFSYPSLFVLNNDKVHCSDRMAPMVNLQKQVYISILRKELPKLLALSSGASSHQSLQNIVRAYFSFSLSAI